MHEDFACVVNCVRYQPKTTKYKRVLPVTQKAHLTNPKLHSCCSCGTWFLSVSSVCYRGGMYLSYKLNLHIVEKGRPNM